MSERVFSVDAILFDMDGTLVDSTAGVVGAWETFKESYPDIDVNEILSSSHGVRTVDNLRKHCGITDPALLEKEAQRFEEAIVTSSQRNGRRGIVMLPGTEEILKEIQPYLSLPSPRWAICTSATRVYATAALKSAKVPQPEVLVVAEDVENGKPQYAIALLAPSAFIDSGSQSRPVPSWCWQVWRRSGQLRVLIALCPQSSSTTCLVLTGVVLEDAPSGIRSGRAAGCKAIGLLTTHSREQMEAAEPDFLVKDLSCISVKATESGGLEITVSTN